jgi:hypothetical protein
MAGSELFKRLSEIFGVGYGKLEGLFLEGEFQRLGMQGGTGDKVRYRGVVECITQ